jgi:orotate phosphoribosyltransferase
LGDEQAEKLIVKDVVVLIDREQGGPQHLNANGLTLHAAFTLSALLKVVVFSMLQIIHLFYSIPNILETSLIL